MRLALIGAFPFPYPQGSQVYFGQQRDALRRAGADPIAITYPGQHARGQRARSGPNLSKPFADAALLRALVKAHRQSPFEVVIAHNAEAAVVALTARTRIRVPVLYVAHTILRHELPAYASERWQPLLDPVGGAIDAWISRRADGIIALSEDARTHLRLHARCPIEIIPPGLEPAAPPTQAQQQRACRSIGLEPQSFVLYAGNLDSYQELELLDEAAKRCREQGIPFVVATHDARDGAERFPNLTIAERSFAEIRALHFSARVLLLSRRRRGGFPIKLLNYMEAGRPIVAFRQIAPGLEDGVNARLLDESASAPEFASAIRELWAEPALGEELGDAARQHLLAHHDWNDLAERTLAVAEALANGGRGGVRA